MLTNFVKNKILDKFSKMKLSYENIIHKKVYKSDYIVIIPKGIKTFVWFTYLESTPICLFIELNKYKKIINVKQENVHFSCDLAQDTILYGTLFNHLNNRFFSVEDIFSYKGKSFNNCNWLYKLEIIHQLFKNDLDQVSQNSSIIFGLPIMCKTNDELNKNISNTKYNIASIQYKLLNKINNYLCLHYNETNKNKYDNNSMEAVFLVRANIQHDIYNLYCLNEDLKEEYHSDAHIKDYNTSVMMNNLFRVIKENKNLDSLEESDDEEEFNNDKIDKFLQQNIEYKMICSLNKRFKRWVPIRITTEPIISFIKLQKLCSTFEHT
jgi:hypothetical protein